MQFIELMLGVLGEGLDPVKKLQMRELVLTTLVDPIFTQHNKIGIPMARYLIESFDSNQDIIDGIKRILPEYNDYFNDCVRANEHDPEAVAIANMSTRVKREILIRNGPNTL